MKKLLTSLYTLVVSSLLAVGVNAQPNLLTAGDFEGISNPIGAYAQQVSAGVWGTENGSVTGAANGITPLGTQMFQINHSGGGTSAQTNQIVHGPFKAGSVVTFSVKLNSWLTSSSIAPFPLQAGVSIGNAVLDATPLTDNRSGPAVGSPLLILDTDKSTWQTATVTTTLTSDTDYLAVELFVKMNSGGPTGTPLAYAEDAVLTVVPPTPGTNWVNWTGSESASGITKYVGHIVVPRTGGGSTTVTVKYTPPTLGISFIQTTGTTDYFAQGNAGSLGRVPAKSPYTSSKVTTIPDGGGGVNDKGDIIGLRYAGTNTLEFTDASTGLPISIASPVFAYVSLNGNGYGFDQDFDILSFGDGTVRDRGYFGSGTSSKSTAVAGQYRLIGTGEPHGTLQFRGAFSTVTWQSLSDENWNGFTIGVAQLADDVPIANAGPDQTVTATSPSGATVNLSGSASGSTKTPFTYTWSGAFGSAAGQNPTVSLPIGTHTVTLDVRDTAGSTDSDTVVITVLSNPAPVITSASSASGTYGAPFSYTITATHSPTSFGASNLPAGLTLNGAVISGTPTEAGIFGVSLSATNSGGTGTKMLSLNIAKANATVVVTPYNVTFDGNPHSATVTITGVNGETGASVGTVTLSAPHTNAGVYSDSWSFNGGTKYNNIGSTPITNTIDKANATVTVNGYTGTYDGAAHGATGFATGVGGVDLSAGLSLGATFTNVPGGTANWTFSGGTNYNNASGTAAIVITKANATVTVNGYTGTYDAVAHGATGSAKGVGGVDLSADLNLGSTFTNAPGGTATWTFSGGTNYHNASGTAAIVINKADATVIVNGYTGTYDATAHGATGSATGVGGADLSGQLNLGSSFTNAPGGTANWTFSGGTNYKDASGTAAIVITKANATVAVDGYNGVYDAAGHGATGSATGIGGVNLVAALDLGAKFTNVPGGTANWTFSGGTNYHDVSGTAAIMISKANAAVVVTPYSVTYNGQPHSATVASITGANGETGATVGAVTLDTTHTDAGTYADSWNFVGAANYNDIASTAITNTIAKASATVVVTPYNVTYNGQPHSATVASITGVNGETGATVGTVTLNTTHTNAGTYADSWSFAGTANYNPIASTTVANSIAKANAAVVVTPYNVTYNGQAHSATVASITGVNGETGATVGVVTLNTTHINAGTYADSWSMAGTANYNHIASTAITNTVAKASATVVVTPYNVTYNGQPHSATVASITGVNGETGATVGAVTLNTTHTNAGTYADSWSFAGAGNYNNIASTPITNTIAKAAATVVVTPYHVTYDGAAHSASATITGVNGESGNTVGSVTLNSTHTNAGTYSDSWSFAGAANYRDIATTPITDKINQAATKLTLGAVPTVQAVGQPVTLTATAASLTPVIGSPVGTVTFMMGSTLLGTSTLNGSGVAVLTTTAIPLGPQSVTATYSGSSNFIGSASSAVSILIYSYPAGGGTFVIGDGNATVGNAVTFWGSQWEKKNSLSAGSSNASFKGFAVAPTVPVSGGTFTAASGNSAPSPAGVPAYLGVIVTSKVAKSGSNITGTIVKMVVVKVNPGYAGNPGSAGTGTVVAVVP